MDERAIIEGLENIQCRMHGSNLNQDQMLIAEAIGSIKKYHKMVDDIISAILTSHDLTMWIPVKWIPHPDYAGKIYEVTIVDDGTYKRECATYEDECGWQRVPDKKPLEVVAWHEPSRPYTDTNVLLDSSDISNQKRSIWEDLKEIRLAGRSEEIKKLESQLEEMRAVEFGNLRYTIGDLTTLLYGRYSEENAAKTAEVIGITGASMLKLLSAGQISKEDFEKVCDYLHPDIRLKEQWYRHYVYEEGNE